MRLPFAAAFSLALAAAVSASEVQVVRVWPGYRTAESFKRIAEYFTGEENPGSDRILRTQPAAREGFYFLTRVKNTGPALADARVQLSVIAPTSPESKTYDFSTPLAAGSQVLEIGLTGTDWTDAKAHPVAWLIRITSPDGTELVREQSFLWSQEKN